MTHHRSLTGARHPRARRTRLALALGLAALAGLPAWGAEPADCTAIEGDALRLACYDRALGRRAPPRAAPAAPAAATPLPARPLDARVTAPASDVSALSYAWELDPADKRGTFNLVPHKLNYLLPARYTNRVNTMPGSPAPGHSVDFDLPIDATEAKFQFSFKVKAFENLLGDNGDLWLAYTQQSNWQLYNSDVSSPFRETDYEPEVIFSLRTDVDVLGWRWRMVNLGFVHQSNGRPEPLSRSWNRVYAQFGFERGDFTVLARPWVRISERAGKDDNPDIVDYMGHGDLRVAYARGGHVYSLLGRYAGSGRGALQLEWAFPISGSLKGYLQLTSGYGESLIDYNHKQTTLGLGILLLPWQ